MSGFFGVHTFHLNFGKLVHLLKTDHLTFILLVEEDQGSITPINLKKKNVSYFSNEE